MDDHKIDFIVIIHALCKLSCFFGFKTFNHLIIFSISYLRSNCPLLSFEPFMRSTRLLLICKRFFFGSQGERLSLNDKWPQFFCNIWPSLYNLCECIFFSYCCHEIPTIPWTASQPASQPNINLSLLLGYLTQNMLARLNVIYIWQRRPLALSTNKLTFIQTSERIPANNARSSLCVCTLFFWW